MKNRPDAEHLWYQYAAALLVLLVLVSISFALSTRVTDQLVEGARIINDSGRQRLLVQRSLFLSELLSHEAAPELQAALNETLDQYEETEARLVALARQWPGVLAHYRDAPEGGGSLTDQSEIFVRAARSVAAGEIDAGGDLVAIAERGLPRRINGVVAAFEKSVTEHIVQLRTLQYLSYLATLIVLVLEAVFIFAPAYYSVRDHARSLKEIADAAMASRNRQYTFAAVSADILWELDRKGRIVYLGGRMAGRLGRPVDDFVGKTYNTLVYMRAETRVIIARAVRRLEPFDGLITRFQYPDGREIFLELSAKPRYNTDGEVTGYAGVGRDVSDRVVRDALARKLAEEDPLTELLNRRAFLDRLAAGLSGLSDDETISLMVVDLDRFKPVNDLHGHAMGDHVLRIIARRIRDETRSNDWVSRFGGDEFVIAITHMHADADARRKAETIIARLKEPIEHEGNTVSVGASIGICQHKGRNGVAQDVIERADQALYHAKRTGRDRVSLYSDVPEEDLRWAAGAIAKAG